MPGSPAGSATFSTLFAALMHLCTMFFGGTDKHPFDVFFLFLAIRVSLLSALTIVAPIIALVVPLHVTLPRCLVVIERALIASPACSTAEPVIRQEEHIGAFFRGSPTRVCGRWRLRAGEPRTACRLVLRTTLRMRGRRPAVVQSSPSAPDFCIDGSDKSCFPSSTFKPALVIVQSSPSVPEIGIDGSDKSGSLPSSSEPVSVIVQSRLIRPRVLSSTLLEGGMGGDVKEEGSYCARGPVGASSEFLYATIFAFSFPSWRSYYFLLLFCGTKLFVLACRKARGFIAEQVVGWSSPVAVRCAGVEHPLFVGGSLRLECVGVILELRHLDVDTPLRMGRSLRGLALASAPAAQAGSISRASPAPPLDRIMALGRRLPLSTFASLSFCRFCFFSLPAHSLFSADEASRSAILARLAPRPHPSPPATLEARTRNGGR
ncbi:hypothetical protein MSAN_00141900 [Mycena sanguinolenta]|uniref:Uncharacterized protein n=1 Tax=Mycena sanguinolenta TaxID=230812 RepID=A0A8H6ZDV8_9AGAR|nr:hypothetical protein MSAN_00141900 [Mycena sanguinolenta]